jgi:hypothetical protein
MSANSNGIALSEVLGISNRMQFHGDANLGNDLPSPLDLGESLSLVSNRTVELSTDFATRILQLNEFVVNDSAVDRNLRDNHVEYLVSCMQRGLFRPEWVSVITCECEEAIDPNPPFSEYRMNGQHCAWARIEYARLTGNSEYRCAVRHMKYKAKTIADMRVLYTSIDRGAPRTAGNVINAHLAGTPGFVGVPKRMITLLASGLAHWLEVPGSGILLDPDTKAVYMQQKYRDLTLAVKEWMMDKVRTDKTVLPIFQRAPVAGALFDTFNKLPSRAHEFWDVVATGIGVAQVSDPRYRLRERLRTSSLRAKGFNRREKSDAEDMYSWCINAWNNWRAGKEVTALKGAHAGVRPKAK